MPDARSCQGSDDLIEGQKHTIVGEAANRVPHEKQSQHPEIPWPQIIGLRNRLIHGYDAVDYDILWQIITEDLPLLVDALEVILSLEG